MRGGAFWKVNFFRRRRGVSLLTAAAFFFALSSLSLNAADSEIGYTFFAGIEIIELAQNDFSALGRDNFTFTAGFSSPVDDKTSWGLRYSGIGVELSEEHLQEPSPAYRGDFSGVTGTLDVHRLYADYYYTWDFRIVKIQPVASFSLGYNAWSFYNRLVDEDYKLRTFSAGISGRFRFTLMRYVFIEIPCIDIFGYLYKDRGPEAYLGDAHIAFNTYGGVFNWIYAGISVPLEKQEKN